MKVLLVVAVTLLLSTSAHADGSAPDIATLLTPVGGAGATAALVGNGVYYGASAKDLGTDLPKNLAAKNVAGGYSKDKRSYWASAELPPAADAKTVVGHASALWEKTDKDWKLLAFAL